MKRIFFIIGLGLLIMSQNTFSKGSPTLQAGKNSPLNVSFCDLVKNPEKYNGQEVTVQATYSYGFEWQDIFCVECRNVAKTWLEFDKEHEAQLKPVLKKFPKDAGIVNGTFSGTFQSSGGPFGNGGYRLRLLVKTVSNVEVVYKGMPPPGLDLTKQMCACSSSSSKQRAE